MGKTLKSLKFSLVYNTNQTDQQNQTQDKLIKITSFLFLIIFNQDFMASNSLLFLHEIHENTKSHDLVNLPRFSREFIGISHNLEEKKKERKKIQEEQRAVANRVIYLQKEQQRAQKTLKKKKSELSKMLQTLDRTNLQKQQKDRLRQMKELELAILREQNKAHRLLHKQAYQNAKFTIQNQKHQIYSRVKSLIKQKQQEKKDFLFDEQKNKKDKWMNINIEKQKGKQKIDEYFMKKNKEHTLNYMQMIQKQQMTKMQKINTIKQLEVFESALKKKLEESSMRVSKMEEQIMKSSRTLECKDLGRSLPRKTKVFSNQKNTSNLSAYEINPEDMGLNLSFQKQSSPSQNQNVHSLTERNRTSNRKDSKNQIDDHQIQERIEYPNVEQIEASGFKIIRTVKRRKKSTKNRYKEYQL